MSRPLDEERIFHVARGLDEAALRDEYLSQVCAGDQGLRERVEELLNVHENEQSFLKSDAAHQPTAIYSEISEGVGQQVGRFKLLQKIGEGGFGVVYMAEQSRPVRRKVALKLIKPGMDTGAVVARFEAERQALALMDHPNIAKVLDGGATESGRPYFVMELVKGVPVTEFCDENKLTIRQRLEMFTTICRAIQHAHQKGIIHRDIKPSNVLVTLHDGQPVPKVIDFGVSKAISQQLTEKTLFTAHGQMIGTPQYMSPEQAEMSGLDIDTRSDIYSLGILLYELLTGVTPLDPERIRATAYAELQRLIREDEPVQPSKRCSTLGEQSVIIATRRKTEPNKLGPVLRGELDWIVMKTLEKDRNRRYETPDALAKDVENYLNDETVNACPPSMAYQFQKFARRNKTLLLTTGTIVSLLLVSSLLILGLYIRERKSAREAKNAKDAAQKALEDNEVLFESNAVLNRQQTLSTALSLAAANQHARAEDVIQGNDSLTPADKDRLSKILLADLQESQRRFGLALETLKGLNPSDDDLIVRSMIAAAYAGAGEFWSYYMFPEIHGNADPQTPYDHLVVGRVESWLDFTGSIKHLNVAVELTRSPIAFTARARSLAWKASSTRLDSKISLDAINQAVADVEIATKLYTLNNTNGDDTDLRSDVVGAHLQILLLAYDVYSFHASNTTNNRLQDEVDEIMAEATKLSEELSRRRDDLPSEKKTEFARSVLGFYHHFRAKHLRSRGFDKEAVEKEEELANDELMQTFWAPWLVVADLIRLDSKGSDNDQGQKDKLLLKLDEVKNQCVRSNLMLAYYHLFKNEKAAGRKAVYELIDELKQREDLNFVSFVEICHLYRLLGDLPACHAFASQHLNDDELIRGVPQLMVQLEYHAGIHEKPGMTLDDNFLLNSRNMGSTAHRLLIVGLSELSQGHRKKAKERFQQAADEGIFHAAERFVAMAFLDRLKDDPNWLPPWMKQSTPEAGD